MSIGSSNIFQITISMVGIIIFILGIVDGFSLINDSHYLLERLTKKKIGNKGRREEQLQ